MDPISSNYIYVYANEYDEITTVDADDTYLYQQTIK